MLFKEKTVLIVDDEPALVKSLAKSVARYTDHNIVTAQNGEEALNIVRSNKHHIYFILSDVKMPIMNGIDFAKTLKEDGFDIPLFFITGNYDTFEEELKSLQPKAVLRKPYSVKIFKETIKKFMV